jgi:hypothetical protein
MNDRPLRAQTVTREIGGDEELPISATFKASGKLLAAVQLFKGEECSISIAGPDGEIIASGPGWVHGIQIKEHRPANGPAWDERIHTIKIDEEV